MRFLFPLLLLLFLLVPASSSQARQPLFGFNEDWISPGHEVEKTAPLRPTSARFVLGWAGIEREPGSLEWGENDRVYARMRAMKIRPIAMVIGAPCWASANLVCDLSGSQPVGRHSYPAWENFIRELVTRYPDLAALEIWNEPNLSAYFLPRPRVKPYVEALRHAYRASKQVRPALPVLGGSLAPVASRAQIKSVGGFARPVKEKYPYHLYLAKMYRLGAARYMDGLAYHPYVNLSSHVKYSRKKGVVRKGLGLAVRRELNKQFLTIRRLQNRFRARSPIWVTETGICTSGGPERRVNEREQAIVLKAIYRNLEARRVRSLLFHRFFDVRTPGRPNSAEQGCGLLSVSGRVKRAHRALSAVRNPVRKTG